MDAKYDAQASEKLADKELEEINGGNIGKNAVGGLAGQGQQGPITGYNTGHSGVYLGGLESGMGNTEDKVFATAAIKQLDSKLQKCLDQQASTFA